jgi:poly(A) polymerase
VAYLNRSEDINYTPAIVPRSEHGISRADIGEHALTVLYRLENAGFKAYLVGGGVRDLLLGREPKDFDVVTDAHPEQVQNLFRNCRLIGRRFRLAHVFFGREVIEVATFRAGVDPAAISEQGVVIRNGRIIRDNVYGTIEEDALRRDFTVNSLYYDISNYSVVDYVGALHDLSTGTLRTIGDPDTRFREDPVRMLRAVRFAAKLGFRIASDTEVRIFKLAHLIEDVPAPRLFEEVMKLFHGGCALVTFELLRHYGLFGGLFPNTEKALAEEEQGFPITFVSRALQNTDNRINSGQSVTPAFLYAVLLWEPVRQRMRDFVIQGKSESQALQAAGRDVTREQIRHTSLPRRFGVHMRDIWQLQLRFKNRGSKRRKRLLAHPRFRAAYDFLCLRAAAGEELQMECEWWTQIQNSQSGEQRKTKRVVKKSPRYRRRAARQNTPL